MTTPTPEEQFDRPINVIFDGPPSHQSGRFIEVETDSGQSVNIGEWIDRKDGTWALRIVPAVPSIPMMTCGHGAVLCARCDFIPPSWRPNL